MRNQKRALNGIHALKWSHHLCGCDESSEKQTVRDVPALRVDFYQSHALHHFHAALHTAENGVFAVEPGRGRECDEELRAVGVRAGIGH
jgi:hypothetical protein